MIELKKIHIFFHESSITDFTNAFVSMLFLMEIVTSSFLQRKQSFSSVTPQPPSILMQDYIKYLCVKKSIFLMSDNKRQRCFAFTTDIHSEEKYVRDLQFTGIFLIILKNWKVLREYSKVHLPASRCPAVKHKKTHQLLLNIRSVTNS